MKKPASTATAVDSALETECARVLEIAWRLPFDVRWGDQADSGLVRATAVARQQLRDARRWKDEGTGSPEFFKPGESVIEALFRQRFHPGCWSHLWDTDGWRHFFNACEKALIKGDSKFFNRVAGIVARLGTDPGGGDILVHVAGSLQYLTTKMNTPPSKRDARVLARELWAFESVARKHRRWTDYKGWAKAYGEAFPFHDGCGPIVYFWNRIVEAEARAHSEFLGVKEFEFREEIQEALEAIDKRLSRQRWTILWKRAGLEFLPPDRGGAAKHGAAVYCKWASV